MPQYGRGEQGASTKGENFITTMFSSNRAAFSHITLNAPFLSQSMFIQQSLVKSVGKTNFSSNGPGMDFVCHSGLPKGKTNNVKSTNWKIFECL